MYFQISVWSDGKELPHREFSMWRKEVEESFRRSHGNPGKRRLAKPAPIRSTDWFENVVFFGR